MDRAVPDFSALGGRDLCSPPAVRLDLNNGPEPPPGFGPALVRRLPDLHRYGPEHADELRARLAMEVPGPITAANIVLGAGSMALLRLAVEEARSAERTVIAQVPGYAGFRRLCAALGAPVVTVPRRDDHTTNEDALVEAVSRAGRGSTLVYLNHPVNPTGGPEDLTVIDRILAHAPQSVIIVDEAYAEFHDGPGALDVSRHAGADPLIVTRSFSKARALAGIRLGYAVSGPQRTRRWRSATLPGSISALTQAAALAALDEDQESFTQRMRELRRERDHLATALEPLIGVPSLPSVANFLTFPIGPPAAEIVARAAAGGIAVRTIVDEPGLPDAVRVTVGTRAQNERLIAVLADG